ncbi:carbohydrate-binding protein, partial [Kitasatospora cinereorecta]
DPGLSGSCSSVTQNDWDFTKYTVKFAGATPPTTPPTTQPPTSQPPGSCTDPAWSATTTYVAGNKVSYSGHKYHAKWWTLNENPASSGQWGPWADDGPC